MIVEEVLLCDIKINIYIYIKNIDKSCVSFESQVIV